MSTRGKTPLSVAEASESFISDIDNIIGTPLTGRDSLDDAFGFEDIDIPPIVPEPTIVEDVTAPGKGWPANLGQWRLRKSLSEIRRIVDWIMGRDLVVEDRQVPVHTAGKPTFEEKENAGGLQSINDDFIDIGDVQDTCPACTTPYCQAVDSLPFKSSLRLNYNDPEMHSWLIGDKYIMTEAVDTEPSEDTDVTLALAAELLRKSTRVPIPNVIAGWKENGKAITIVEQVPGQRLYDIWWDLSKDEREQIAGQVAHHIDQWRRLKADRISSLSGGGAYHEYLFGTTGQRFGPFRSDEQMWESIEHQLEQKKVDSDVMQVLKDYMPESAPCVFTHGDLSCANIIIHNGRVSGILGFDNAACLPAWAENIAVHFCSCKEDEQWKALLSKHMKSYARAKDWWLLWMAAEKNPKNKKRIAALVARCRRWQKLPLEKPPFDVETPSQQNVASESKSQQTSFQLNNPPARKPPRDPWSIALSKKLLKGRHYSELLNDRFWELAVASQSEMTAGQRTGGLEGFERDVAATEGELAEWEEETQDDADAFDEEETQEQELEGEGEEQAQGEEEEEDEEDDGQDYGDDDDDGEEEEEYEKGKEVHYADKRTNIERWLLESERGRRVFPGPFLEQKLGKKGESPHPSPLRGPPWRERQRSFERGDNTSKGLRPFSLPVSHLSEDTPQKPHLSESFKQKLRETEEGNDEGNESRETLLEKTLQSLESGSGDAAASPVVTPGAAGATTPRSEGDRKRISMFRERNMPGLLYMAVANTAVEGRNRRHQQRSRSEERASGAEGQAAGQQRPQQRPRPHSLMPQADKKIGNTEDQGSLFGGQ
ncbi:hypothetical protein F4821DRAFT_80583 [Hypoxylon rubiginosum]|uniref:Uncharacterized protein n=1 Tax=Hypoxylon rubiginosum TaxID=110542 RepID=A0ACC0DLM7_9PEZI|nr:hypothetical protein F4821DRAFT_80583 [Hypoxylon rubiginosum]